MQARAVLRYLHNLKPQEVMTLPISFVPDDEFTPEKYMEAIIYYIHKIRPSVLVLSHWPDSLHDSPSLEIFLSLMPHIKHVETGLIYLDFEDKSEAYIDSAYRKMRFCLANWENKPYIICLKKDEIVGQKYFNKFLNFHYENVKNNAVEFPARFLVNPSFGGKALSYYSELIMRVKPTAAVLHNWDLNKPLTQGAVTALFSTFKHAETICIHLKLRGATAEYLQDLYSKVAVSVKELNMKPLIACECDPHLRDEWSEKFMNFHRAFIFPSSAVSQRPPRRQRSPGIDLSSSGRGRQVGRFWVKEIEKKVENKDGDASAKVIHIKRPGGGE